MTRTALLVLVFLLSCGKVPIHGVEAGFAQADASWFEAEETLFVFYEVQAEQGLGEPSVIEITYATDDERVDWTPIEEFQTVHTHVPVDCGVKAMCGSTSIHVPIEPREVGIRLRYHRDGELALDANTRFNAVAAGDPHTNRSALIYGVFDATNQYVQWRSRNQFPTVRNERATELGLRRLFTIRDTAFGTLNNVGNQNPYLYGRACPFAFTPVDRPDLSTIERAIFEPEPLPLGASADASVCAQATVTDATGTFTTSAFARKNPEVRSAFPALNSPVYDATTIPFFLGPCDQAIYPKHEAMQRQRLFLEGVPTTCIDDWTSPGFVPSLVVAFRDAVEAERPAGRDMVLTIALHQDTAGVSEAVEEALAQVVPNERHRSSPRLAGAFVFDSDSRGLTLPELKQSTLWCPSTISPTGIPDASARSCATLPDIPELNLGPFTFGTLQILPAREDYLDFLKDFSESQAGEVTSLEFLTPEFAATSEHVDLGEFGVVTFLNGETIDADPDDAFSYCLPDEPQLFVVRSGLLDDPYFAYALYYACATGEIPAEICEVAAYGLLPIEYLPDWHNLFGETSYDLGLFWEFPFLLRMEYRAVLAGSVSAFGLSVPFGVGAPSESYYGAALWEQDEFPIDPALTQCRRFCDHPTFDSAGVYHVTDPFRTTYAHNCYLPHHPKPGDPGFPLDP